ncbi:MAG: aminotransferase class I/II-fold pyridoxal phosphate-dependent enzyme [Rickettsiaceae bacterium]
MGYTINSSSISNIEFLNEYYGACYMVPVSNKDKLRGLLNREDIVILSNSIGIEKNEVNYEYELNNLIKKFSSNLKNYKLGFYEIYSSNQTFLGVAGFLIESENEKNGKINPKIYCYLFSEHTEKKIEGDVFSVLTDYAFQISNFDKVSVDNVKSNQMVKTLEHIGYVINNNHLKQKTEEAKSYEITRNMRHKRGLLQLSRIISENPKRFIPRLNYFATVDMERSRNLWHQYFGKGLQLCTGGSNTSFLTLKDLNMINLEDFKGYRTDKATTTYISEAELKNFLYEEQIIKKHEMLDNLNVSFCLGSHEGLMRLGRVIYNQLNNNGLFAPYGSYGLTVNKLGTMKPAPYKIHLVDMDRDKGEKLNLESLKKYIDMYPNSKTLLLEIKTLAGAIYTEKELNDIIALCKLKNLFLIMDYTHYGMELSDKQSFPDILKLCFNQDYHQFAILYTGSKVYGLERARIGFTILSKKNSINNFFQIYSEELYAPLGEIGDLPFEVTRALINTSVQERKRYKYNNAKRLRFNMNLMIAYIEGINSPMIDSDLKEKIRYELTPYYTNGIDGVRVLYKPLAGMQMKVDVSNLQNKYFSNIRMYNSEIFSHALNRTYDISTLHAFKILDPYGFSLRLAFMDRDHVHRGMRSIKSFVNSLTDKPTKNEFFPEVMSTLQINQNNADLEHKNLEQKYWKQIIKPK